MAHSTPLCSDDVLPSAPAHSTRFRSPIVYWHLLSLDAPTVAMLWTWFIAESSGVRLPMTSLFAMGIAVWILYAIDRLLDARSPSETQLELRHRFHQEHRGAFLAGIALASCMLGIMIFHLNTAALRLYMLLSAPLAGYYLLIHLRRENTTPYPRPRLPKEIAVGVFFSAATFIPAIARHPALRRPMLPLAALFGLVCCLNCLFIYAWEHPAERSSEYPEAHPVTRFALRFLSPLSLLVVTGGLGFGLYSSVHHASFPAPWQPGVAVALAAVLLMQLHSKQSRFDPVSLRAAGDLCLLTPLLLAFSIH